jgi:hypothetical protein
MENTLKALDALIATFLEQHSSNIANAAGEVVVAVLGLLLAWIAVRRTKIKTAADGAVDTAQALSEQRVFLSGPERKKTAQVLLSEATGIASDKLSSEVQKAFERRKALQKKKQDSVRPPV